MKILVIAAVFPPHVFGGGEVSAFDLARLLKSRGHTVSVLTMAERDEPEVWGETSDNGISIYRLKFPRRTTNYQAHFEKMSWLQWKIWHLQDFLDFRMLGKISRVIDEVDPDHLNIHILDGIGFNTLQMVRAKKLTVSYFLHELAVVCSNGGMYRNGKNCESQCAKCQLVSRLKGLHLRHIRGRVVYVSPSSANLETVRRFVPAVRCEPGLVLRNVPDAVPDGLPTYRFEPENGIRLLYVGRIHETKGVEFLLRVLRELAGQYKFHLSILGRGPDEEKLIAEYGSLPWVSFRGFVDRETVTRSIASHDLLCVPSIWAEIYGRVTAEALKLCTPVFGSAIGGTTELIRDGKTGLLLAPGDEKVWRDALAAVFNRPDKLLEWRKNAADYASEFDATRIAETLEQAVMRIKPYAR